MNIVANLNGVTYIDSAGVGMMVAESKMVREKGGVIKGAQLTARSHHLLAMLKLKVVFESSMTKRRRCTASPGAAALAALRVASHRAATS